MSRISFDPTARHTFSGFLAAGDDAGLREAFAFVFALPWLLREDEAAPGFCDEAVDYADYNTIATSSSLSSFSEPESGSKAESSLESFPEGIADLQKWTR